MKINFKPCGNSAFDELTSIRISPPRALPEFRHDGRAGIEFQYTLSINEEIIDGFGISGFREITKENGERIETYTLEISHESTINRILQLKQRIGNTDSEFEFIAGIAKGMVSVFTESESNIFAQRHIAITNHKALDRKNIEIPAQNSAITDDSIILAESYTPPHPVPDLRP